MSTSGKALLSLSDEFHSSSRYSEVKLGEHTFHLARSMGSQEVGIVPIDGEGGSKRVFGLPDGRAVALPNLSELFFDAGEADATAANWERTIYEEKTLADRLSKLGLETQRIEILPLHVGNYSLPVMVMPRFSELEKQGLQIRDVKNLSSSCGNSMLFGTPQHVEDSIYLKSIMKGLLDDTVILIKNGLDFGLDTINVIIKDTTKTIPHNRAELGAISTRNQEARLFFFDFSKARPYDECKMKLLNATGEVDSAAIREHAEYSVNRAYSALKKSIKDDEVDKILELKKEFPSHLHYDHWYKLDSAIDVSFEAIKKDLVEDVAVRATKEIQQLAHEERIAQFRTTTGVQLEKNITSVVNNVIHNASTQGEKITEKSNGKMKWVVGGIVAATATIGADIAWKKKSHVGQEDERRQFSAGQQIRTI